MKIPTMRNPGRHLIFVMLIQLCLCDNTSTDISVVTSTSRSTNNRRTSTRTTRIPPIDGAADSDNSTGKEQQPQTLLEPLPPAHQVAIPGLPPQQDKAAARLGAATLAEALAEPAIKSVVDQIYSKNSAGVINDSKEGLAQESSDRDSVVFLPESPSGYIPVTSLRGRPSSAQHGGGGLYDQHPALPPPVSTGIGTADLEQWRAPIEGWERDYRRYRFNNTRVQHIEAECQDDYMKIRVGFNGSFTGLLYSAGYAYDPDCMYINGTGRDYYEFYIQLNRCGTLGKNTHHEDNRKNPTKNFMWNTVTVQYNPLIEEEFDEHFKVTCEYGYDFWKTVTFPFLDVEVATGNPVVFTLTPPECYMEIRSGYGTGGARVAGPVRVGDPLTLIIYMRSKYDGFDLVVNDCYAHNGANKRIQMIDEHGCPVDDKLISRFRGSWSDSGVFETQVFAYMKTFRFTGSPALYIECDVRMCHGRCPTQPCHWRNTKILQKRSLLAGGDTTGESAELRPQRSGKEKATDGSSSSAPAPASLSDNISLFQALRVLQEGEGENEEGRQTAADNGVTNNPAVNQTCVRTSVLSAILASLCASFGAICATLLVTCVKLRHRTRHSRKRGGTSTTGSSSSAMYDSYINHKGQID